MHGRCISPWRCPLVIVRGDSHRGCTPRDAFMSDGLDRMLCRKAAVVGERQAVNLGLDSPPSLPQELSPFTIPLHPVLVNGCLGRCSRTDHPSTNPMAVLERHWRWWPAGKISTGEIFILDDMFSGLDGH